MAHEPRISASRVDVVREVDHGRFGGHAKCCGNELGVHDVDEIDQPSVADQLW